MHIKRICRVITAAVAVHVTALDIRNGRLEKRFQLWFGIAAADDGELDAVLVWIGRIRDFLGR